MKKLSYGELHDVNGGGAGIAFLIGAGITFIIGVIDGQARLK